MVTGLKQYLANRDIYTDQVVNCCPGDRIILLGQCTGRVEIGNFSETTVIAADKTKITINVDGLATVHLYCFDSAFVNLGARNGCRVYIHHIGKGMVVNSSMSGATVQFNQPAKKNFIPCYQ